VRGKDGVKRGSAVFFRAIDNLSRYRRHFFRRRTRWRCGAAAIGLLVPELVFARGSLHVGLDNLKLVAALVAAPVAWRTKSTTATILVGMAALLLAERYL
jgi:branched-subunit amino acid transport protein